MYSSVFHFFFFFSFFFVSTRNFQVQVQHILSRLSLFYNLQMNILSWQWMFFGETSWIIFRNTCITTNNKNYKLMSHMSDSVKQVLQPLKMATKSESDVTLTITSFWGKLKLMSVAINFFLLFFRSHMSALLKEDQNSMLHQI